MLKFKDATGKTVAILEDEGSEPILVEDKSKKKKSSQKKTKSEMGYFERPLPQTNGQVPIILSKDESRKSKKNK